MMELARDMGHITQLWCKKKKKQKKQKKKQYQLRSSYSDCTKNGSPAIIAL